MTTRSIRRRLSHVLAATVVVGLAVVPAASAAADPATDGFWYFDAFNIQAAHDAGYTGKGVTIGVIDTQINPDVPTLQGADLEVQPSGCYQDGAPLPATSTDVTEAEHGTNVASYLVGSGEGYNGQPGIKGIVPDARIIYSSVGVQDGDNFICESEEGTRDDIAIAVGIKAAIDNGADIISISLSGTPTLALEAALANTAHLGIPVIASMQNEANPTPGESSPGTDNSVIGVQSLGADGAIQGDHRNIHTAVAGPGVQVVWQGDDSWEQLRYATGTSIATPIVAGFLALVAQKYPDATGNQLIQTLLRNTGPDDHEFIYDDNFLYGYGTASATHMLRVDPTQYEDVNPLIFDTAGISPSPEMIENPPDLAQAIAELEGIDHGDPGDPDPGISDGLPILPIVLGAVGLLVLIGIIILIIVIVTRRGRAAGNQ